MKIRILITSLAMATAPVHSATVAQLAFSDTAGTNVSSASDSFGFLNTAAAADSWVTDGTGHAVYSNSVAGSFRTRNFTTTYSTGVLTMTFSINAFSFTNSTTNGAKAGFGILSSTGTMVSEIRLNHATNANARFVGVDPTNTSTTNTTNLGLAQTGVAYLGRAVVNLDADTYLMEFSLNNGSSWTTITNGAYTGDVGRLRIASQGPTTATADPYSISFDNVTIDYIPEPSAAVLALLGSVALLRRRRACGRP